MDICSRNVTLVARRSCSLIALALLLCSCKSTPPTSLVTPAQKTQPPASTQLSQQPMRGIWLATVSRLDWPPISSVNISNPTSRMHVQQQALTNKLDQLQRLGINTVFFQVKPDGTALWPSQILPWSDAMTGKIGQDPGYDPLQFMLDEAHKRGMKVHAWFNPYRVSVNIKPGTIRELNNTLNQQPASVYVQHRDWIKTSGDRLVLDPGIPEVQQWITNIVAEVVSRYPVDGVQFDDYFYTESAGSKLNDNDTFRRYGAGFASKADWRRHNTQQLITQVSRTIKNLTPMSNLVSARRVSGATVRMIRWAPIRAVPQLMMSHMPTLAVGYNSVCWITSPHKFTGPSHAVLPAMMCWQNGGPM